jgi:modulator of FtsH protease
MLAGVVGLQFAIVANRNSPLGIVLLLLMTAILGWWIGPMLNFCARAEERSPQLVRLCGRGHRHRALRDGDHRDDHQARFQLPGQVLFVGMIALIIAMFANMFLADPARGLALSTIAIVIFSLFLLHDLSRIVTAARRTTS